MLNKGETDSKNVLFKETLTNLENDIKLTLALLTFFFFLALFIKFVFSFSIPFFVFVVFFAWVFLYFSYSFLIKRKKNQEELYNFYFRNSIIDLFLLTVVIHYLGGAEWIGAIFYLLVIALSGNFLPKKKTYVSCAVAVLFYSTLILLEYFQILPHRVVFGYSAGLYRNLPYVLTQILVSAAIFLFISESCGTFSEKLKKKQEELIKAQEEADEARGILEIKVRARTRELQELAGGQEEIIKERTREIQDKMRESEVFHKLAVGRELKMIELKKEIKKLEEK